MATGVCAVCGAVKSVKLNRRNQRLQCTSCSRVRLPCSVCGTVRVVCSRTDGKPVCRPCHHRFIRPDQTCAECESTGRDHRRGLCSTCGLRSELSKLLAVDGQDLDDQRLAVLGALMQGEPRAILKWLDHSPPRELLRRLATRTEPISHQLLDDLGSRRATQDVRGALVAAGVLAPRDEQLATLERWEATASAQIEDPDERQAVRSFARWHHLRRLRQVASATPLTYDQMHAARTEIAAAIDLLAWLAVHNRSLTQVTQADIDQWVISGPWRRYAAAGFLHWAVKHHHTRGPLTISPRPRSAARALDDDQRWTIVRHLIHDTTFDPATRIAGLLCLLFAQPMAKTARLTVEDVSIQGGKVTLALGPAPLELPSPLDALVADQLTRRRGHSALGTATPSPWLFPGRSAGKPITGKQLLKRLQLLGIRTRPGRHAALLSLASQLPAAVISDLLGISIGMATNWAEHTAAHRAAYAAEIIVR